MATEITHEDIKSKKEDHDLKEKPSALSLVELPHKTFEKEPISEQTFTFVCSYAGITERVDVQLPKIFHEFLKEVTKNFHLSFLSSAYAGANEVLIHYYDESVCNYIDLDELNWSEFRERLISRCLPRTWAHSDVFNEVRLIITTQNMWRSEFLRNQIFPQRNLRHLSLPQQRALLAADSDEMSRPIISRKNQEQETEKELMDRIARFEIDHSLSKTVGTSGSDKEEDVTTSQEPGKYTEEQIVINFQPEKHTQQPKDFKKEYSFIYLLTEADRSVELKNVYANEEQTFHKPYECLSEIVKAGDQNLIIIVSQSLSKHFIPLIHDLIQVIYIYILHKYDTHDENADDDYVNNRRYRKIRGSFVEQTMLQSKLNEDLEQLSKIILKQLHPFDFDRVSGNIDFYMISKQPSSIKLVTAEEKDFISFQFIIKTILESGSANPLNYRNTSLQLCSILSNSNKEKLIEESLKNYVPEKAIHFYLSDTSLKDETNSSFQDKNMQKICKLWFFIHDLLKQLPDGKKSVTVYRKQCFTTGRLEKLQKNIGGFITFNKFFPMSTSNIEALICSEVDDFDTELIWVVFQLEINNKDTSTRFSMIQQSYEEQIFLFAAGNIFRIESVEKLNGKIWRCKLSINSDDKFDLNQMFQHYETEIGTSLTYLSLGVYLDEIGENDLALQYYETLLIVATDPEIVFSIYNNLAIIFERKNDLKNAEKYWDFASKLEKKDTRKTSILPSEQKLEVVMADSIADTSPILNYYNLACTYQQAGCFGDALEECEKALKLSNKIAPDSAQTALIYSAMGNVYYSQKKYEDALKFFENALDIALIHLTVTDPQLDQYLNNVRVLKKKINEKES